MADPVVALLVEQKTQVGSDPAVAPSPAPVWEESAHYPVFDPQDPRHNPAGPRSSWMNDNYYLFQTPSPQDSVRWMQSLPRRSIQKARLGLGALRSGMQRRTSRLGERSDSQVPPTWRAEPISGSLDQREGSFPSSVSDASTEEDYEFGSRLHRTSCNYSSSSSRGDIEKYMMSIRASISPPEIFVSPRSTMDRMDPSDLCLDGCGGDGPSANTDEVRSVATGGPGASFVESRTGSSRFYANGAASRPAGSNSVSLISPSGSPNGSSPPSLTAHADSPIPESGSPLHHDMASPETTQEVGDEPEQSEPISERACVPRPSDSHGDEAGMPTDAVIFLDQPRNESPEAAKPEYESGRAEPLDTSPENLGENQPLNVQVQSSSSHAEPNELNEDNDSPVDQADFSEYSHFFGEQAQEYLGQDVPAEMDSRRNSSLHPPVIASNENEDKLSARSIRSLRDEYFYVDGKSGGLHPDRGQSPTKAERRLRSDGSLYSGPGLDRSLSARTQDVPEIIGPGRPPTIDLPLYHGDRDGSDSSDEYIAATYPIWQRHYFS
ncbi:hypothetical protein P168DRAFT_320410 [Aspergillus campestris IBT 28561]|uniref:Uncharacterized protein n=1 Tax=Aspergillus campestris (strain IBT 28561) TaxID=1392248 RepID=A0A2I1CZ44_ASPC2|nr:uncharacterized protein P168DRAFT_320410 [Aspergillus campestris IBT 28561]PKY02876.1 hypothetical protein P168DRAFT_320410 [Aspergillus campestris IBT 28561]